MDELTPTSTEPAVLPTPSTGEDIAMLEELRHRVRNQTHDHWFEFSIIVAGANIVLALGLGGRIVERMDRPREVTALATLLLVASLAAVVLAYYSIQVGPLLTAGRLRVWDIVLSFLIAGAQLALFLWPTHVLAADSPTAVTLSGLDWWLLAFVVFAASAAAASSHAAKSRGGVLADDRFRHFRDGQDKDRSNALASAGAVAICWVAGWWIPVPMIPLGAGIALTAAVMGIKSQAAQAQALESALEDGLPLELGPKMSK